VLWGLAVFALIFAGTSAVVERWLPSVIDPVHHARLRYIRQGQARDPRQTRTLLFFGTSRTYVGVHAGALSRWLSDAVGRPVVAVNWGIPGCTFAYELLTWQRLRRDGVRPDLLLLEVMPSLFFADGQGQIREDLVPTSRVGRFDLPLLKSECGTIRPDLEREVALMEVSTLYSRRYALAWALWPGLVPPHDDKGNPFVWPVNLCDKSDPLHQSPQMRAKALARAYNEYHTALTDFRTPRCEALRALLSSCREAGVPTALLVMPEGPEYRSWYAPATWPRIQAWLDAICKEFACPVINAREWMNVDDFSDSHHLLPQAASRFSERLGQEAILSLLHRLPSLRDSGHDGEQFPLSLNTPPVPRADSLRHRPD
jgi:hypothetical protein